ncbi:phosphate acyltransferase [bacterium BMS3Abin04]|nr:phosphate acyltransferase [bacterium BMS3Abin04]
MDQSNLKTNCIIAVDAMGGDKAPHDAIIGALDALNNGNIFNLLLVGRKTEILDVLKNNNLSFPEENIINANEIIGMKDSPTAALKTKKDSSIVVGANLVKDNKAHAFVSAGNTGAMMAASILLIGRIPGVGRPTIGATIPTETGTGCTIYDVGASVDSKPHHLLEYAIMGSLYAKEISGINNPSVGLLSVGEEDSKGNKVTLAAFDLLKNTDINFIGNIEGRDILKGKVDIVVCDGFVGNILLKFAESIMGLLKAKIRNYADASLSNKLKALVVKGTLKDALKDMDYQAYGGVPLLGINGISIIGHGSSTPLAFKNMILRAYEMHRKNLLNKIEGSIKNYAEQKKT